MIAVLVLGVASSGGCEVRPFRIAKLHRGLVSHR
jgi:hypothetical protein